MPEYLAPGVYVEETSFRSKSIEGVSTTTTGFVGPTRYGPIDLQPDIITSLGEFERIYGDRLPLQFNSGMDPLPNYMWHAVRAFFEEGGRRLYIARIFEPASDKDDGFADAMLPSTSTESAPSEKTVERRFPSAIHFRARFPGEAGNMSLRLSLRVGRNVLSTDPDTGIPTLAGLQHRDVVWYVQGDSPLQSGKLYRAEKYFDKSLGRDSWQFNDFGSPPEFLKLESSSPPDINPDKDEIRVVTLTVTVRPADPDGATWVWEGLPPDPDHERAGVPDSVFERFSPMPASLQQALRLPIVVTRGEAIRDGLAVLQAIFGSNLDLKVEAAEPITPADFRLEHGNDGQRPLPGRYTGEEDKDTGLKTGLVAFEDIEDISIVAAPGSTYVRDDARRDKSLTDARAVMGALISHSERMRYRIAVLDSVNDQATGDVRDLRAKLDSKYAALYYPWIRIVDPVTQREIHVPPSGAVAGIYARNDIERAVYKAPANEVVRTAIGFEKLLNKGQQDVLNPEGINCFRFFEGRGFRLWGARTISSDPEWKYVNLRRYFIFLERSIDKGTQWAVFEPNGSALWANVRRTIEDFLLNEWQMGALLGDKPESAYFVKCDRSTMTQNDLDNGRLVCLIGVAALRPAEFVIFRIGQWTADKKG